MGSQYREEQGEDEVIDYGYEPTHGVSRGTGDCGTVTPAPPLCEDDTRTPPRPRRSSLKTSRHYRPRAPAQRRASSLGDNAIVQRRPSITFHDHDDVKEVEPAVALTDEPLWMSPVEHVKSKEDAKSLIRSLQKTGRDADDCGPLIIDENVCIRGLEHYLDGSQHNPAWTTSRQSRSLVLRVQASQKLAGMPSDEEMMSQLYGRLSLESARRARRMGAQDFAQVQQDHRMTKRSLNRRRNSRRSSM